MVQTKTIGSAFSYCTRDYYAVLGVVNIIYSATAWPMYAVTREVWVLAAGLFFLNIGVVFLAVRSHPRTVNQHE